MVFYTGHFRLKKPPFNMGISSYANYQFCDMEAETPEHLILDWIGSHRLNLSEYWAYVNLCDRGELKMYLR